ncbi:MAG: PAS domain-containing protein, partial [Verrucomicrobia bacterium]|nr:PAS domain-containing protein [Verrucomicrobiota bacterium]
GEEAYSIAMLLLEYAQQLDLAPALQVFACDLDESAIQEARAGIYPEAIAADVSDERLHRFFVKEARGYRVRRELREMILFAVHDVLKDAPFSRLDLISCRNLLIYLNREAQDRLLETFHFALRPGGRLFLGSSESVDEGGPLFRVFNKKHHIYTVQAVPRTGLPVPTGPSTLLRLVEANEHASAEPPVVHGRRFVHVAPDFRPRRASSSADVGSPTELHFRLIERFSPPSVLVDADCRILHLSDRAGKFLRFSGGEATQDLLRLVHPDLRVDLRAALFRASENNTPVEVTGTVVNWGGETQVVDLRVSPAGDLGTGYLLVVFDERESIPSDATVLTPATEPVIQELERELERTKRQLRDTVEQYEAANEEMKASNEELQAMNEELRSATEELETSREELQSINEELVTVNQEMKSKVEELGHAYSDLQNLMAATSIATVFLDRQLTITRYTPSVTDVFYLIPSDTGRPLAHLRHRLDYPGLIEDAERVLRTLVPIEREVQSGDHRWYLARLQPYRTVEDNIAGVVMTFIDVTERKRGERELAEDLDRSERLQKASERLVPEGDMQALFDEILDAAVTITGAAAGAVQLLDGSTQELRLLASKGFSTAMVEEAALMPGHSLPSGDVTVVAGQYTAVDYDVAGAGAAEPARDFRLYLDAGLRSGQSTLLVSRSGKVIGVLTTHWRERRRLTDRERRFLDLLARQAADAIERQVANDFLRQQMEELIHFNDAAVGRETRMIELKREVNVLLAERGEPP